MTSGIYLLTCAGNGVVYIGQSYNIESRWLKHKSLFRSHVAKTNRRMYHAVKKYGLDSVSMTILEACESDRLTCREQFWVDAYRATHGRLLANSAGPADSPARGVPMRPEAKAKMIAKRTGQPCMALRGDANPSCRPEFRQRMRANNPTKRADVRATMSANSGQAKIIRDRDTGQEWRTMTDCAIELGVSRTAVQYAATGRNPTVKGRRLEFGYSNAKARFSVARAAA